tara:strand:+ start:529 stop:1302 length:774 start_codon:yes stop_codon:yes gene_type:complete
MAGELYDFLTNYSVGGPPKYYLSLPTLWKIQFSGAEGVREEVNKACTKAGEAWRVKKENTPDQFVANGNTMVAREVTVPGEMSEFLQPGADINKGGFLPAFGVDKRTGFLTRTVAVNILDTDDDLEHTFFRPWMIAIGIDGLINRGLLCPNIVLRQYNNKGEIRKGYTFTDVFPTSVEGYTLNYDKETFLEKSVTFAFKNYAPLDVPASRSTESVTSTTRTVSRSYKTKSGLQQRVDDGLMSQAEADKITASMQLDR